MKIIEKIKKAEEEGRCFFSFEYFPPKTDKGVQNLYSRMERMSFLEPLFVDVTWGAGGSTSDLTFDICNTAQNYQGLDTQMHLTCTNTPVDKITQTLLKCKESGLRNILALRGDPPQGQKEWKQIEGGFANGSDLVRYIRQEHGDHFGIAVAGYPEGHIQAESYEKDLFYLKAKVEAGADFIVTQLFYDVDLFLKFVRDCRDIGIFVPILPGIMPIHTYNGFVRMTTMCKTFIPSFITEALEPIKSNDEAVKSYGIHLCIEMCKKLLENGIKGLHFYTLNLEKSVHKILKGLGLITNPKLNRPLPWRPSCTTHRRTQEDVRPIFWSQRPQSYICRTESWDDFPNGRWGDSRSPAYGDIPGWHLVTRVEDEIDLLDTWGRAPSTMEEICNTFVKYCKGEIRVLPWNTGLVEESQLIQEHLIKLNRNGFLTINSQPRVNGADSSDAFVGWGGPGGYVYQKAYIEFFTSPEDLARLLAAVKNHPSLTYHAINCSGSESFTNTSGTNAVTWGVFPGKEIIQPTVVHSDSFLVWKGEAFSLWNTQWGGLYEKDSVSRQLIDKIVNEFFLVNIVDNNFVSGNIFAIFDEIIDLKEQMKLG